MLDNKFLNQWLSDHWQHAPIASDETRVVHANAATIAHLGQLADHTITVNNELSDGLVRLTIVGERGTRDVGEYQGSLPAPLPAPPPIKKGVRRILETIGKRLEKARRKA